MSLFLRICRGESQPGDPTPIWLMRQAGRYMPEYQATRAKAGDFLTLCRTPDLACEVTLQPVEKLGVDAAILFSDILVPLPAMGIPLSFTDEGPKLEPVRSAEEIAKLAIAEPEECRYVYDAVRLCRQALERATAGRVPLIGFAGAPFTLMTYAVEGQTSKQFTQSKRLMFEAPEAAHSLLHKLTETVIRYLKAQVEAGAQALQLFDSWAGILSNEDYAVFARPYVERILTALKPLDVPLIYFAHGGSALYEQVGTLPADVFAVDWRLPIDVAVARLGLGHAAVQRGARRGVVQGNLDPALLFGPIAEIERRATDILDRVGRAGCGHIFNLGHGVLPQTPVEHVKALVDAVHRHRHQPEPAAP
jgi:uroporphyrinogen decarboxylase